MKAHRGRARFGELGAAQVAIEKPGAVQAGRVEVALAEIGVFEHHGRSLRHRKVGLIQPAAGEEHVPERAAGEDGARQPALVEDDPGEGGFVEIGTGEIRGLDADIYGAQPAARRSDELRLRHRRSFQRPILPPPIGEVAAEERLCDGVGITHGLVR